MEYFNIPGEFAVLININCQSAFNSNSLVIQSLNF